MTAAVPSSTGLQPFGGSSSGRPPDSMEMPLVRARNSPCGNAPTTGSHQPQVNSIHPRGTSEAALAALSSFLRSEPDNVPAAKTRDVTEFLAALGFTAKLKPLPIQVTYQAARRLLPGQKIREAPRALLHAIPKLDFVELPYSEICCGSAGVYNVTQTETSLELLAEKMRHAQS